MEKHQTAITIVKILLMITMTFFLIFYVFQEDNLERQVLELKDQLKKVKDTTDSSSRQLGKIEKMLESGAVVAGAEKKVEEARKWLHPEVENFLEPDPFSYVCEEAVLNGKVDGVMWQRWSSDPKGFNPVIESDAHLRHFLMDLCLDYTAFSHWDNPEKYAPRLAERIEVVDDYKTWIFYFRKGVKWHKPRVDWSNPRYKWLDKEHQVTAHDFAFYLKVCMHPDVQAGSRKNYYEKVKDYEVIDDYTLRVNWQEKQYQSMDAMTDMFFPVPRFIFEYDEDGNKIPEDQIGKAFNDHWFNHNFVGCGPYEFADYKPGEYLKLRRNEHYWGPLPQLKEVNYFIYTDAKQVLLKMKSGEQDFADVIRYEYLVEEFKNPNSPFTQGKIKVKNYPVVGYTYIAWNSARPLFSDKRTRRAMTHAFNREAILSSIVFNLGTITTGPFFHDSMAYNKNIKPYPFDLEESRRLLSECGWEDTDNDGIRDKMIDGQLVPFSFTLLIWKTSPQFLSIAEVYRNDLRKIGVDMYVQPIEWSSMLKKMDEKEFDAFTGYWVINYRADPYQLWHSSQADAPKGSNRVGFRNKRADEIIEIARKTFEPEKRAELFHEFHEIVHEEQPYTFFYSPIDQAVWWDHVKNVKLRKERPHTYPLPYYIDK